MKTVRGDTIFAVNGIRHVPHVAINDMRGRVG